MSDKFATLMSALSYIHCKVPHIQKLTFSPLLAAGPQASRQLNWIWEGEGEGEGAQM